MKQHQSICFISPYAFPLLIPNGMGAGAGGAERQFFLFGEELVRLGWRVSFITNHPAPENKQQKTVLPVYTCSFSYLGGSNLQMPSDWLSLFKSMKKVNSDYYVIKVPGHLLTPLSFFCRFFNKKLVFWGQMTFDANPSLRRVNAFAGWLQDWGVKRTNIVIAQTQEQQYGFLKSYGIKSSVVPSICKQLSSATSSALFVPDSSSHTIDVLWAGNSALKKRYEVVVKLARLMPEIVFGLAMNISDPKRFVQAKRDCQTIPNMIFLGMVPPAKMETIFSQTTIFLNTSTQEGFPNTFLQAWMNGMAVVSLCIDPDNVITTHDLGRIVNRKYSEVRIYDFEYLAHELQPHIIEILNDNNLRNIIGDKALEYTNKYHSSEVVVPQLIKVLENSTDL